MLTSLFLGIALSSPILQDPPRAAKLEMKTHQFVFLRKGKNTEAVAEANQRRQREHLENLEKWWLKEGKAVFLGPLTDNGDIRGIIVFNTSAEEAKRLVEEDPFIKSGQMVADIRPLMAADGILQKPPKFMDLMPYTLGFFHRPEKAPDIADPEKGKELQAGHLANLDRMWKAGILVWAGPFLDNTPLRGLLIFRETDVKKIQAMVAEDPLVKAGRLEVEYHPAITSKGAFPPPERSGG